jgi:hypothetical protein
MRTIIQIHFTLTQLFTVLEKSVGIIGISITHSLKINKLMKTILLCFFSAYLISANLVAQRFEASESCQNNRNVNDSNWGSAVNNMKDAVVLFQAPYKRLDNNVLVYPFTCTGNMINQNTNQASLKEIFVTAEHCCSNRKGWDHDNNPDTDDIECELINDQTTPWLFYFNYSSPGSSNDGMPVAARNGLRYNHSSAVRLIDRNAYGDFAMGEILNPVPPHFNIYNQGWSASMFQAVSLPNYVLHHPRSDIKKWAYTHSTITLTNTFCHLVTQVIDVVYMGLFGWWTGTQINTNWICTTQELPFWFVPVWSAGATDQGSSGSGLLNKQEKLIGVLSWGFSTCGFPLTDNFGKLSTAVIRSSAIKNTLEPNNFWAVNADGRRKTCNVNLHNLAGNYFPAKDYQPENKIQLKAANEISTLERIIPSLNNLNQEYSLSIIPESDWEFVAGNAIRLRPGFRVLANSNFRARIGDDCAGFTGGRSAVDTTEKPIKQKVKIGGIAKSKKPVIFDLVPNPSTGIVKINVVFPEILNEAKFQVTSLDGKTVHTQFFENLNGIQAELDLSSLPPGIYITTLQGREFSFHKKLVITR